LWLRTRFQRVQPAQAGPFLAALNEFVPIEKGRMAMARKFQELIDKMSAKRQAEIKRRSQEAIQNMALDELRVARQQTQEQLAETLNVDQAAISKLERRTDVYVSTLALHRSDGWRAGNARRVSRGRSSDREVRQTLEKDRLMGPPG